MKAILKFAKGPGNVEIRDIEEPACGPDQVKLEVAWCGVCGTDIHVVHDTFRNFPPVVLGHEMSATIVEIGRNVTGLKIGERYCILGATAVTCGRCVYCRHGQFMFCAQRRGMGHGVNGAFTQFVVVRPDQLFRLPPNLSLEEGAVCEPFAAVAHAVCDLTPLRVGDVVLVSGPGPMGLLCLKLLVAGGFKTIVAGTDADTFRLEQAKKLGADAVINVTQENFKARITDETNGLGVDVAFECAGAGPSLKNCFEALRPLGHLTQVGHYGREISTPFDATAFKQIRVAGSVGYTEETWLRMLRILERGKICLGDLISHKLPIDEWQAGFAACENRSALKVLLHP
jgi:L-iditol 2-dehydrogenase